MRAEGERGRACRHVTALEPDPFRSLVTGCLTALVLPLWYGVRQGDQLVLRERTYGEWTGNWTCRRVTHAQTSVETRALAKGWGLYCLNNAAENGSELNRLQAELADALASGRSAYDFWQALTRKDCT